MNRQIILGAAVIAMGITLRFPLSVIQVLVGLLLFAVGVLKLKGKK